MNRGTNGTSLVADARVEWDLDEIARAGVRTKIEPRHMRVLACLAVRPGEVVSRSDLLADAWPETIVEDDALTQSISILRRAFGDDVRHPRVIQTVPKKGYRLIAPVAPIGAEPPPSPRPPAAGPAPSWHPEPDSSCRPEPVEGPPPGTFRPPPKAPMPRSLAAASLAVLLLAAVLWALSSVSQEPHAPPPAPLQAVALTTFDGREAEPALSPDGRTLAFVWNGPDRGRFDLWATRVGSEAPSRLTNTAELETGPAWSPDGRSLAFARVGHGTCGIHLLAFPEGTERRLAGCGGHAYPQVAFSPDGRTLAVSDSDAPSGRYRISLLSLASGERRPLTGPVAGLGDRYPAVSPDGRLLAFVRGTGMGASDVHVVPVAGGPVRRLTRDGAWSGGVTWSHGGRSLIASSNRGGGAGLWRVPLDGGEPRWLGVREPGAVRPSRAVATEALVFERQAFDTDVWALDLADGGAEPGPRITSTRHDGAPRFSPDGRLLAFVSDRSGSAELWIAGADGASPRRSSALGAARMLPPRWAPDGRALVVAADRAGHGDLFLVPLDRTGRTEGAGARPLAPSPTNEVAPAFSADGREVFFMSDRGGSWRLWAVRLATGRVRPVTDLPLSIVFPTTDGRSLYASRFDRGGLWRVPLAPGPGAGEPELLVPGFAAADWGNWSAAGDVLHYLRREGGTARLERLDVATGAVTVLGTLPISEDDQGLTVSPDGRTVLFTRGDRSESDVFLVADLP